MRFDGVAKEFGVKITEEETKIITRTRTMTPVRQNATVNDYNFEQVKSFVYLGRTFTKVNNEINRWSMLANKAIYIVPPILKDNKPETGSLALQV